MTAATASARSRTLPALGGVRPQLAVLGDGVPVGAGWLYEAKLDGYRALASVDRGRARLVSRNGSDWTKRFDELREALAALPVASAIFDGEICALDPQGRPSFQLLQDDLSHHTHGRLVYFVFDLLFVDGVDLRARPLTERKARLEKLLAHVSPPLALSTFVTGAAGKRLFAAMCRRQMEGVIAKRADGAYRAGRSSDWVKVKCSRRQELAVIGYTAPRGSRKGLGALLLGVREGDALRYAGKVGTGFSAATLVTLQKRLRSLAIDAPSVKGAPRMRDAHWVRPELVAEIGFSEWTRDGALRHPTFLGLREDKTTSEVTREAPTVHVGHAQEHAVAAVVITHPDRVIDDESALTKRCLVDYYDAIAPRLLRHASRRPVALFRCPDGAAGKCFFQKQRMPGMPEAIHAGRAAGQAVVWIEDATGLVSLIQFGTVELHGWGSRFPTIGEPDQLVMDLDPDVGLPFSRVVEAAREVRESFAAMGLESFVKTTGGKGLHVVAPLEPRVGYSVVKGVAKAIADELVRRAPDRYTAVASKTQRTGRVFLDYLRNGEGATAILPYAVRARPGAPVAWPVSWRELASTHPQEHTVRSALRSMARRRADPWKDFFVVRQSLAVGGERGRGILSRRHR